MYYLQALLLSIAVGFITQRNGRLSGFRALMILAWVIGVSLIYWKYGPIGQLSFYQNDQRFHWDLVVNRYGDDFNLTFNRLNFFRLPYTAPAYLLSKLGFDPALALKFISLCCAIANIALIEKVLARYVRGSSMVAFWLTAGPISIFFSMLALRETMMLLCVSLLFLGTTHSGKAISLVVLAILRPHLAAAVLVGMLWGWIFSRLPRHWYLPSLLATALGPIYLGTLAYSLGNFVLYRSPLQLYDAFFQKNQVIQIFSSFLGLQFLTVAYQTVEFSTQSLLLIRLLFSEIVLIPLLFSISCFIYTRHTTRFKLSILATFVFFVSVSSSTEFLSVRQSLPIMSIMGMAVILSFSPVSRIPQSKPDSTQLTTV